MKLEFLNRIWADRNLEHYSFLEMFPTSTEIKKVTTPRFLHT